MKYAIQSKQDIKSGLVLTARVPERDIDRKAMLTVQRHLPPFALPFHSKHIDGEVEFTYTIGSRTPLKYSYGACAPKQCVEFWNNVLMPLLECDDWFMNPFSFVLQPEFMYTDKATGAVSFVYIPSVVEISDYAQLQTLAREISDKCSPTDTNLENIILRSIMYDFSPRALLQTLKPYSAGDATPVIVNTPPAYVSPPVIPAAAAAQAPPAGAPPVIPEAEVQNPGAGAAPIPQMSTGEDDIIISEVYNKKGKKEKAPKPQKPAKPEKPQKPKKEKAGFGLFGGSKKKADAQPQVQPQSQPQQIILGAAAQQPVREPAPVVVPGVPAWTPPNDFDEVTRILNEDGVSAVRLRLVGNPSLPALITVSIDEGRAFTIGRFDISVGIKQSDFEFEKSTKAVSRRHAAIERSANGFSIVDLSSSAGTFVNGQRLTPNLSYELSFGSRVSFGTAGADYMFEG
jgi:hypothetical protein